MHQPSFLDPLGSRLPALERNLLKLRSVQMVLVLFYAEQLKSKVLSLIQNTDGFLARAGSGRQARVPKDAKNQVKKCLDALETDGALSADEKAEIRRLIDYRNVIGHDIHDLVADISTEPSVRRSMGFLPDNMAKYDYEAVDRLQHYMELLDQRQRKHHYIGTLSFDRLRFRTAERVLMKEIHQLREKIARQWKARHGQINILNQEMRSAVIEGDESDPLHPSNQYEGGRLTKRGEEICYRLFDQGLSPFAVAHLMGLSLAATRKRHNRWKSLGEKQRPSVDFESLPERKYYLRRDD